MSNNLGEFYRGSEVRLECLWTVTDSVGDTPNPTDPATVTLRTRSPAGTLVEYTYAEADIERLGEGRYAFDLLVDASGTWAIRWEGTGLAQAATEDELIVLTSAFPVPA